MRYIAEPPGEEIFLTRKFKARIILSRKFPDLRYSIAYFGPIATEEPFILVYTGRDCHMYVLHCSLWCRYACNVRLSAGLELAM